MSEGVAYSYLAHANDVEPSVGHRALREGCPLHVETGHSPSFFLVSRHADVLDVLTRPKEWSNGFGVGVNAQPGGVLGTTDDPDHRRQRRVLQGKRKQTDKVALAVFAERTAPQVVADCANLVV